eukprot:CAMPEP_0170509140 /NCGR_PEP_ID=MMETSP0208-20121228/64507_1 /TAXON_ID=197538 /ORGANISM="Strombidium inclinatum, Strain S3" /LENGTH=42 /DNA_ID= /DNA_START= /DNA_END= /DNA_ORIENTATION=
MVDREKKVSRIIAGYIRDDTMSKRIEADYLKRKEVEGEAASD